MLGQMLVRAGATEPTGPLRMSGAGAAALPRSPMSSTGTTTSISNVLRMPASTMTTGRSAPSSEWPPRKCATSSSGRCVADSPMRWGGTLVT